MKKPITAKVAGTLKICDVDYTVYLGDPTTYPACEEGVFGYTVSYYQYIVLDRNQPKDSLLNTLLHEIQHAIWHKSGIGGHVAAEMDVDVDSGKFKKFEEDFIQRFTPYLVMTMQSMRKLKI